MGATASQLPHSAGARTDSLCPPKLVRVTVATCWHVDRRQNKHGQTAPLQAKRRVSIDAKGRPVSQTDAQPDLRQSILLMPSGPTLGVTHGLSRFTRVELNAALCKATGNKAGVDDLLQRSGNA